MRIDAVRLRSLLTKRDGNSLQVPPQPSGGETASLQRADHVTMVPAATDAAETFYLRLMIIAALVLLFAFGWFFFYERNTGFYTLYVLLCISLGYKLVKILFEWYHYWSIRVPVAPADQATFTVDVLTTAMPGEPFEMIRETLTAMVHIRYPHTNYLCDEGNSAELKALCQQLGVIHVTRQHKVNAKAGNINNALRQATGDICVVLDPDHAPLPQFLDEVLPYFSDPEVGFVQVPQMYRNAPETWIAQSAAQQTYSFYGPLMKGMNSYGTVQAIGANCTFRRKALDSIGGHAAGLSEDMHTAMRLHAKGWKSVYKPAIVTRGLVPSNIEAYYKQQLKWSRGTFELLFTVFPLLFSKLNWRQRIHYFLLPLHFAAGIIVLIDIVIPIIALLTGEVPVFFNTHGLFWLFIPVVSSVFLVRQYAQRWLMERHERGFHFSGGILLFASWWVYTVGFIYTLLRVKVPYIPTPKDNEKTNNLVLHIPNIVVSVAAIIAIAYGLHRDWNPYNFIAAAFAMATVFMLFLVMLASQQLFLQGIKNRIRERAGMRQFVRAIRSSKDNFLSLVYATLRTNAPALFVCAAISTCLLFAFANKRSQSDANKHTIARSSGGFYSGVYLPGANQEVSFAGINRFSNAIGAPINIVSVYQSWSADSVNTFPKEQLKSIAAMNCIPMITWEPWVQGFPANTQWPQLKNGKNAMAAVAAGVFDNYLRSYAIDCKIFNRPLFIRFAQEPGNPAYPWSKTGDNTAEDYKKAWQHIVKIFAAEAADKITWVWNPWQAEDMMDYYPGAEYVDWTSITALNYGKASFDGKWRSFNDIYQPYRQQLLAIHKPVMLAEFGSTSYGLNGEAWLTQAIDTIGKAYPEIESFVFFNTNIDKNWVTSWRPSQHAGYIDWTITRPAKLADHLRPYSFALRAYNPQCPVNAKAGAPDYTLHKDSTQQSGIAGNANWAYIKGIVYNSGPDWQDGHLPLTMNQLKKDFAAIRETGCNTISRPAPSAYDKNIFHAAHDYGLKVIYGFRFDPFVDYYTDSVQVSEYTAMVIEKVKQYHSSEALLAWCVGSQTSTALDKNFVAPYLSQVKSRYLQMIENITAAIHQIDPDHPVISPIQYSLHFPAELAALRSIAPSVDITGINSFGELAEPDIATVLTRYNPGKPYVLTGFGPEYPADSSFGLSGAAEESSDLVKSDAYIDQWNATSTAKRNGCMGGIAFCWQDNYETTATAWGLLDWQGRKKPSYYALKKAWTGTNSPIAIPRLFLVGPDFSLLPGAYYSYTAVYENSTFKKIEWRLLREDIIDEINTLELSDKINKIWIKIPAYGRYRLYVYLHDDKGNVTTASIPIKAVKDLL